MVYGPAKLLGVLSLDFVSAQLCQARCVPVERRCVITDRNECAAHPERSCAGADKEGVSGILLSVGLAEQKRDHDGQALYCQGVAPVMTTAFVVVSTAELKDFRS